MLLGTWEKNKESSMNPNILKLGNLCAAVGHLQSLISVLQDPCGGLRVLRGSEQVRKLMSVFELKLQKKKQRGSEM